MSARGTVDGTGQRSLRRASVASVVLYLIGCGHTTTDPHSEMTGDAGGPVASGGRGPSDAGSAGALGRAGSGEESDGGRYGAGGASAGTGNATASGGASGGGGPTEMGGNSSLASLPLPARCQPLRGEEKDFSCSLDTTCSGVAGTNTCYYLTKGHWQCTCKAPNADRTYVLEGAAGLDACAVAAGLCSDSAPAFDFASCNATEPALDPATNPRGFKTCTLDLSCETPIATDFAPGVRATLVREGSVKCMEAYLETPRTKQIRVDCEVTGTGEPRPYAVVASGVAGTCRPVLESFLSGQKVEFDGAKSCVREGDPDTSSSCHLTERCFDSAPLSADISIVKDQLSRRANCDFDDNGELVCGCRMESAGDPGAPRVDVFSFDLGPAPKPASCDFSRCTPETRAEATGAGACAVEEGDVMDEGDRCKGYFSCSQPATLQGRAVTLYSQMNALCEKGPDQSFYCGCAAGNETATFRMDGVSTNSDACAKARTDCLAHIALPLGPALSAPSPPDPLSSP